MKVKDELGEVINNRGAGSGNRLEDAELLKLQKGMD